MPTLNQPHCLDFDTVTVYMLIIHTHNSGKYKLTLIYDVITKKKLTRNRDVSVIWLIMCKLVGEQVVHGVVVVGPVQADVAVHFDGMSALVRHLVLEGDVLAGVVILVQTDEHYLLKKKYYY